MLWRSYDTVATYIHWAEVLSGQEELVVADEVAGYCWNAVGRALFCSNGGSACSARHIRGNRRRLGANATLDTHDEHMGQLVDNINRVFAKQQNLTLAELVTLFEHEHAAIHFNATGN